MVVATAEFTVMARLSGSQPSWGGGFIAISAIRGAARIWAEWRKTLRWAFETEHLEQSNNAGLCRCREQGSVSREDVHARMKMAAMNGGELRFTTEPIRRR